MSGLVVIRTQVSGPLEVYRRNQSKYQEFRARLTSFISTFGWRPFVVEHPEGACSIGVKPRSEDDLDSPPSGWLVDRDRRVLTPDRATDRGTLMWNMLEMVCWEPERIPGVPPEGSPVVHHHLPILRPEDLELNPQDQRPAMVEAGGHLWALVPMAWADAALRTGMWIRDRRSQMLRCLTQAGWMNTPPSPVGA